MCVKRVCAHVYYLDSAFLKSEYNIMYTKLGNGKVMISIESVIISGDLGRIEEVLRD